LLPGVPGSSVIRGGPPWALATAAATNRRKNRMAFDERFMGRIG